LALNKTHFLMSVKAESAKATQIFHLF